jgi:hypothetical protein
VEQAESVAQVGDHAVESVGELAELAAAAELGFRFQIAAADALHEPDERLHRPRHGARQRERQRHGREHCHCRRGQRERLRAPHVADKVRFRGDDADHPDQVLTHAKRRGRAEVFGPVMAELEAMERFAIRRGEVFLASDSRGRHQPADRPRPRA